MKQVFLISLLSLLTATIHYGQSVVYSINKAISYPEIDGALTDSVWRKATVADQFTTTQPKFGATPQHATAVRMLAFPDGICIAVDCKTNRVRADGSTRDETGTADYFSVGFDTWNDDQNAFVFTVTASGQLIDQRLSSIDNNTAFNASWKAKTHRKADGWTAEIWIPFSALRFPSRGEQDWGLQFTRFDRSTGETATWAPKDPLIRDPVWQYGQLEGLGQIQQHTRLGLTLMGGSSRRTYRNLYSTGSNYSNIYRERLAYAVDGRVSFNSATTLDIGVVPDKLFNDDFFISFFGPDYLETPISRPLITEENGLFSKTSTLWSQPSLSGTSLSRFYALQPGETISSFTTIKTLNSSRFTTRTKGGIGIGINNTLFDRPDFEVRSLLSSSSFNNKTVAYPVYPNYNQIAVEKAFRNNSWVQFSNSNLYLNSGMTTNLAALGGQWRDITNRFEVKGYYQLNTQFTSNNGAFSVADGYLSAGKVNGKYTWGASWISPQKTTIGVLMPLGSFVDPRQNHQLLANFTKTNYTPRSAHWQNIRQSISTTGYISTGRINENPLLLTASLSGLDQKFRTWSGSIGTAPIRSKEVINFPGAELKRNLSAPLTLSVAHSTDSRKKWILESFAQFLGNFDQTATQMLHANISPSVLIHRKMTLSAQTEFATTWNQNTALTVAGANYPIGKSTEISFRQTLSGGFYISPKWKINAYGGFYTTGYVHQRAYAVQQDGQLIKLGYTIPDKATSFQPNWLTGADVSWYFRPTSLLKLSCSMQQQNYNSMSNTLYGLSRTSQISANLSFLYNLNS